VQRVRITDTVFQPAEAAKTFRSFAADVGAIASFAGYVRGEAGTVETLRLSHYPGMTEAEIERMIERAISRWNITACHITHRKLAKAARNGLNHEMKISATLRAGVNDDWHR